MRLPRCGVDHNPKQEFFAREEPKQQITGVLILTVIVAGPMAAFVLFAIAFSQWIFGLIAALGLAFYAYQLIFAWRESRVGGVFADDQHIGRIDMGWTGERRKVYDRNAVNEVRIERGRLTVLGRDGSTLFASSMFSEKDMKQFADFVGEKVVEVAAPPARGLAVAAVETPQGVLPLSVRRAAGLLQAVGGVILGVAVINVPLRLAFLPESRWGFAFEVLGAFMVFGAVYLVLGIRLGRGLPRSREMAIAGSWLATGALLAAALYLTGNLTFTGVMALLFVPFAAVVTYWLRKLLLRRAR
jgi:hypothetical protein